MNAVVFLDKDGTLTEDVPFNVDPRRIVLAAGALVSLRRLSLAGFSFVVVSNEPGVAQGRFALEALQGVAAHLREIFSAHDLPLLGCYCCPHDARGRVPAYALPCTCRKPAPGLLQLAARAHAIEFARSWFIGDVLDDVEAGRRAGCRTVLIDNGHETQWEWSPLRRPHYIVGDLVEAAAIIVAAQSHQREPAHEA